MNNESQLCQMLCVSHAEENRDMLDRAKFYEVCGKEWLFPSIQDAVHHARFGSTLVSHVGVCVVDNRR